MRRDYTFELISLAKKLQAAKRNTTNALIWKSHSQDPTFYPILFKTTKLGQPLKYLFKGSKIIVTMGTLVYHINQFSYHGFEK